MRLSGNCVWNNGIPPHRILKVPPNSAHRAQKELATLSSLPASKWSETLQSARLSLIHSQNSTNELLSHTQRWKRAETLLSLLGKGCCSSALMDDTPTLTLLTEHWLELSDEQHRYGSNLVEYHKEWLSSNSPQPFFYWLDYGAGKDVDLTDRPRTRLESQKVTYLTPNQRKSYLVTIKNGLLIYAESNLPVHTLPNTDDSNNSPEEEQLPDPTPTDTPTERLRKKALRNKNKYIYVTDPYQNLYVAKKIKGQFHHSSFLNGGAVCAAGGLVVDQGKLKKITPKSGHYQTDKMHFEALLNWLAGRGVDFGEVKVSDFLR
ncbi:hypothetical protein HK097_010384 [Rhizophlyctis rosea]|uniref:Uncharacterized protein n=1 Tax=Rhizophlyctis rosea TaxID=64517 RepID=A0AAD5S7M5_9FUNG|nr:hypothetical protein HK097_010384 [Rhizophlyctis rosea]